MKPRLAIITICVLLILVPGIARLDEWKFDFGASGVATGYIGISENAKYSRERGYGWINEQDVRYDTQDKPNDLFRDFAWSSSEARFRIDVKPGTYRVSVSSGDMYVANHSTQLKIDDPSISFPLLNPGMGEYLTATTAFNISKDHVIIKITPFKDNWLINSLALEPAAKILPATITVKQFISLVAPPDSEICTESPLTSPLTRFLTDLQEIKEITPTRFTSKDYMDLIRANVNYFSQFQDERGAIIDPYRNEEVQYATPAFALAAASVAQCDSDADLMERAAKAMYWASYCLGNGESSNHHEDFYTPLLARALKIIEPHVEPDRAAEWRSNLDFDPIQIYRMAPGQDHWNAVALSGEAMLFRMGLRTDNSYPEECLEKQFRYFTPWGMYRNHGSPAMAYDLFPRMWLTDMIGSGYSGANMTKLSEYLRRGAVASLFMQSPNGEYPTGGRSAQHQWNEAQQCALFEMFALFYRAERNLKMAGIYKRAARNSLLSLKRWQRPTGDIWIVKNRVNPEKRHGFESYSFHSPYNLLTAAMLSIAYDYAKLNGDKIVEIATPCELGGFVLDFRDVFHKVIANAGGMYVEIDTCGDMKYNPTGLIRIHTRGGNPLLGPSDGIVDTSGNGIVAAVGPAWINTKSNDWASLAEMDADAVQSVSLNKLVETSDLVSFEVIYLGNLDGPFAVTERYDLTPDRMELTVTLEGYEGPTRMVFPVFFEDGENRAELEIKGNSIRTTIYGASQTFTALGAKSVKVSDERYAFRNGWAKIAIAEYENPKTMTLRAEPNRKWEDVLKDAGDLPRETIPIKDNVFDPEYITKVMKKVFQYTRDNPNTSQNAAWERGAFYTGVMGAYAATKDEEYLKQAIKWSNDNNWELAKNRAGYWFADNQTCAQTYLELYFLMGGEEKIAHAREILDEMCENPPKGREEWWWCDALYMAPPTFVRMARATWDKKYLKVMNQLWWDCRDFLYDEEANLFYRDKNFFPEKRKTRNGKKIFWSRGNGWVMGGLARVLQYLPRDDPHYKDFIRIYRDMAYALKDVQGTDGMWRTSLHDPEEWPMPEVSGTAFYCFSLSWGINNGILKAEEFLPVVRKAWQGLNRCVFPDGKLGWVQYVAGSPGPVSPHTMREYAPGAFLLSGGEMLELVEKDIFSGK